MYLVPKDRTLAREILKKPSSTNHGGCHCGDMVASRIWIAMGSAANDESRFKSPLPPLLTNNDGDPKDYRSFR